MTDVQTFFKQPRPPKRRKGVSPKVRAEVLRRSQGLCEARVGDVCTGDYEHAHHRRRKAQNGADTAANLIAVCLRCHDWIHRNVAASYDLGLLERSTFDPAPGLVNVERVDR